MVQMASDEIGVSKKESFRKRKNISVLIPALNEAASLPELFRRLDSVAADNNYNMQVVIIDDGSTDDTQEVVAAYEPVFIESIVSLRFRTNLGKSVALSEGANHTVADIIITMDADLQDQPEEIPNLIRCIDEGYDVVSGWKKRRNDPFFGKKVPSYVFNWLVRKILRSSLKDINCGLKAYRKEVWDEIRIYGEFHRFIPSLAANRGFKIGEIEVEHRPRTQGVSKYGASRFIKGILDLLTVYFLNVYLHRPLHFFGVFGGLLVIFGFTGGLYLTVLWLIGEPIGTRPLLQLSILLLIIGVQVILFGLLSQLQIEIFHMKNRGRPHAAVLRREFRRNEG